mmetsp:Transcript_55550/g.159768  ORF Transcript_55550/g.159768 Transcript_55550/m.159768 type:complete len:289 (+) Transcript_55550:53-919(+)
MTLILLLIPCGALIARARSGVDFPTPDPADYVLEECRFGSPGCSFEDSEDQPQVQLVSLLQVGHTLQREKVDPSIALGSSVALPSLVLAHQDPSGSSELQATVSFLQETVQINLTAPATDTAHAADSIASAGFGHVSELTRHAPTEAGLNSSLFGELELMARSNTTGLVLAGSHWDWLPGTVLLARQAHQPLQSLVNRVYSACGSIDSLQRDLSAPGPGGVLLLFATLFVWFFVMLECCRGGMQLGPPPLQMVISEPVRADVKSEVASVAQRAVVRSQIRAENRAACC